MHEASISEVRWTLSPAAYEDAFHSLIALSGAVIAISRRRTVLLVSSHLLVYLAVAISTYRRCGFDAFNISTQALSMPLFTSL